MFFFFQNDKYFANIGILIFLFNSNKSITRLGLKIIGISDQTTDKTLKNSSSILEKSKKISSFFYNKYQIELNYAYHMFLFQDILN
jgi:hypothetical protein